MKRRILIADDDESARSGLADLLSTWGYEVEEAIDLVRASVPNADAITAAAFGNAICFASIATKYPASSIPPGTHMIRPPSR